MSLNHTLRPLQRLATSGISTSRSSIHPLPLRSDRYLIIRSFFTRQAEVPILRPTPSTNSPLSARRAYSTQNTGKDNCPHCTPSSSSAASQIPPSIPKPPSGPKRDHAQDYSPFIRRLIQRNSMPMTSTHRPSKEELLGAATSWWERLRIRLKWFTIRGWRRFNTDDMSAFASWFVLGNTLWILIGTTTFVSAIFATLNSLSLQENAARWISDYMTSETGVTVIFESAIVPRWGASTITFQNVYISRRASETDTTLPDTPAPLPSSTHSKRPQPKASIAAPPSPTAFLSSSLSPDTYSPSPATETDNYTMFDLNLDEVEVTLSFMRWLDGKGLVKDAKIKGVRGVVDRRSVWWDTSKPLSPEEWRHTTRPGDFEFESLQVEDALITVYQPGGQRPFNVSIFNAAVGPLRKRWLFYDMMSAEAITGQFDNCLFSLHMPQKLGKGNGSEESLVKRMARFRIDGLPIEHAQHATGHSGPMSWITAGKLDAVLDIKFPFHPDEQVDFRAIFDEIGRNVGKIAGGDHPDSAVSTVLSPSDIDKHRALEAAAAVEAAAASGNVNISGSGPSINPGAARLARPPLRAPKTEDEGLRRNGMEEMANRHVTVDIDLRFRDLKAAVPIYTTDLSVTNNALIRPIVAFINANRTLVPIHCQVDADLRDFDGSWTLFESGLMSSISGQIYSALAHHVSSEVANTKRIKQVGIWGIRRGAETLLETLRNVVDPVHGQLVSTA